VDISGGTINVSAKGTNSDGTATGIGTADGNYVAWNITGGVITVESSTPPDTSIPGYTFYNGFGIHLQNHETNIISGNAQINVTGACDAFTCHSPIVVSGDAHVSCEGGSHGFYAEKGVQITERAYVEARATTDQPFFGGNAGISFASTHGITNPSGGYVGTYSGSSYSAGSCVFASNGTIPTYVCIRRTTNIQMHRLYNQWTGEHFYTASDQERDNLTGVGWTYEGVGWTAPPSGRTVYRLYNPWVPGGDHHYTLDLEEYYACIDAGWVGEGFGWYSYRAPGGHYQGVPVYRQYNPWAVTGSHNYTTSTSERDNLISLGWVDEGVAWRGV
jgi:hypothetical protein